MKEDFDDSKFVSIEDFEIIKNMGLTNHTKQQKIDKEIESNLRRYMEMSKSVDTLITKTMNMDKNNNTNMNDYSSKISRLEK